MGVPPPPGEESLSLDLHFAPRPLLFLRLLKSFHSFFPFAKNPFNNFHLLSYVLNHEQVWATLSYARGYSTLFTTPSRVYMILSIQARNRSRFCTEPGSATDGIGYIVVSITSFGEV